MARLALRSHGALLACLTLASLALAGGCVEPFGGSNLQMDFATQTPRPGGTDYDGAQAPADTYFTFYGVDHVLDDDGNVTQSYLFAVQDFELVPAINQASPCFIEDPDAQFPGLHVTHVEEKIKEVICERIGAGSDCLDDLTDPPNGVTERDISEVLTAQRRMELLGLKQGTLTAVVRFNRDDAYQYPATVACGSTDGIPAPECTDDESNAQRLAACQAIWADHPDHFEGSDKVFTLPLNGQFFGFVTGTNPINSGPVGGSSVYVDENLADADAFAINWQFKDYDGDGEPDYPADFPAEDRSATGRPFMYGEPEQRTRGVINARLVSPYYSQYFAEIAVFANLADDDVHF